MARTLLLSSPEFTWREWLKAHRGERDLLLLDPGDPAQGPPGRLALFRKHKPLYWRFYGSLDAGRSPHVLLLALAQMLSRTDRDGIVQLFAGRGSPLLRHTAHLCAEFAAPDEILAPGEAALDLEGYPVGPEPVALEAAFPEMVQQAQRKAQWLKLLEDCAEHEVDLSRVCIEGSRLGSGRALHPDQIARTGLGAVHAEVAAGTLLIVAEEEPAEPAVARALDMTHAARATIVSPRAYDDLLCSFADQMGRDFGMGMIRSIDFASRVVRIACTAVPPAPVRILRVGGLRVDAAGNEGVEARPWQI